MKGACLCGGVRFEVTEPFVRVSHCHCESCKKISSNLFGSSWPELEYTSVRLSALEGFEEKPTAHIYTRSVAPWETLPDDGAERFEGRFEG